MRASARTLPAVLVLLAAGCTSGPPPDAPVRPQGEVVEMKRVEFLPSNITVRAGTTVVWVNADPIQHTVTPDDATAWGSDGSGDAFDQWIDPEGSWAFAFAKPGTYTYHCIPHATADGPGGSYRGMVGTVVVTATAA